MPNTSPSVDNASAVAWIQDARREAGVRQRLPDRRDHQGLAGEELAPSDRSRAGVVAITDDGHCVQNHELMRRAVEYAGMFDLVVMDHCQDYNLVGNGVMHEGYWSTVLGLPGWPAIGEEIIVARNVSLAELCDTTFIASTSAPRQRPHPARSAGARNSAQRRGLPASHRADR